MVKYQSVDDGGLLTRIHLKAFKHIKLQCCIFTNRATKVMRMPPNYQKTITETAAKVFGESASVWLIGSRLNDDAKGGDVDLLIKLDSPTENKAVLGARYNALLQIKLGLQKFDVLVIDPSTALKQIHQQALSKGVRL
jgi:hypothetical protein